MRNALFHLSLVFALAALISALVDQFNKAIIIQDRINTIIQSEISTDTMNLYIVMPEKGKHVATMFVPAFSRIHAIQRFTRVYPEVLIDDAEKYESPTERYLKEMVDEWDKKDAVYPKTRAETLRQKVP